MSSKINVSSTYSVLSDVRTKFYSRNSNTLKFRYVDPEFIHSYYEGVDINIRKDAKVYHTSVSICNSDVEVLFFLSDSITESDVYWGYYHNHNDGRAVISVAVTSAVFERTVAHEVLHALHFLSLGHITDDNKLTAHVETHARLAEQGFVITTLLLRSWIEFIDEYLASE